MTNQVDILTPKLVQFSLVYQIKDTEWDYECKKFKRNLQTRTLISKLNRSANLKFTKIALFLQKKIWIEIALNLQSNMRKTD